MMWALMLLLLTLHTGAALSPRSPQLARCGPGRGRPLTADGGPAAAVAGGPGGGAARGDAAGSHGGTGGGRQRRRRRRRQCGSAGSPGHTAGGACCDWRLAASGGGLAGVHRLLMRPPWGQARCSFRLGSMQGSPDSRADHSTPRARAAPFAQRRSVSQPPPPPPCTGSGGLTGRPGGGAE